MSKTWFELKMALRALARSPGYTTVSLAMFALGLGLTIFMFGGVKGYILASMPFPEPERLVHISLEEPATGRDQIGVPPQYYRDWKTSQTVFEDIAGYYIGTVNLSDDDRPERFSGAFAMAGFFDTLGEQPVLGRGFRAEDNQPGAALTVVIGGNLWRHRYNEDPEILGSFIRVNGQNAEVIGVMPYGFRFPYQEDVWVAQQQDLSNLTQRAGLSMEVFGRLKPGVSQGEARASLQVLHQQLLADAGDTTTASAIGIIPLDERYVTPQTKTIVMTLFVSVLLVLAIACSNVANLTLARMSARRREIAIRASLGAGRGRLVGGILLEITVVALVGAAIGTVLAEWGGVALEQAMIAGDDLPAYWVDGSTDFWVIAFAIAAAVASAVIAGFVPAWRAAQGDLQASLRDGGFGSSDARKGRMTRLLVIAQIVLSAVLLINAGLTLRSAANLNAADDGLANRTALTGRIGLAELTYPDAASRMQVYERVRSELSALPGVHDVTLTSALPLSGVAGTERYLLEGRSHDEGAPLPRARYLVAMPNYPELFGIPLLQGRLLSESDNAEAPNVAVVTAAFVNREWPGESAVGRRVQLSGEHGPWVTIVGVIGDFMISGDDFANGPQPIVILPLAQDTVRFVSFAVGTDGNPHALAAPVRSAMLRAEPDTPIYWLRTFEEVTAIATFGNRLLAMLFGIFAAIGLVLAAAGIYAVLAYAVGQRTREIGVRRAMGASDRAIMNMVVGQSGWQYVIGIVVGLILAAGFARVIGNLLVGVAPSDPVTFGLVVVLLGMVCMLAAWIPARRALRIQPMVALRQD